MSRAELIYPLHRNIERELHLINEDPHNKEILTRYYKVKSSKVALATLLFHLTRLNIMSRMLGKKFEDATVEDIEDLIFKIDQRHSNPNTRNKYRKILKAFYKWIKGCSKYEYPPEVRWIEMNKLPDVIVKPEDLLPYEECVRIGECATNLRDKALFLCKLNAGSRIGEILTVTVGEAEFNDWGAILKSDGKTGEWPIILTWSAKTLALWLNNHPFRNDKDAPLWPVLGKEKPEQLSYAAARSAFIKCVKKAGYTRRVWLHLLKHVSVHEDSNNGMPDAYIKYKHHWSPDSKMLKTYQHLSHSVIPKIQAKGWEALGDSKKMMKEQANETKPLKLIKTCKRCDYENPRDSIYCNRCAYPLDERKAGEVMYELATGQKSEIKDKIDRLSTELAKSPEVVDFLLNAVAMLDVKNNTIKHRDDKKYQEN